MEIAVSDFEQLFYEYFKVLPKIEQDLVMNYLADTRRVDYQSLLLKPSAN